MTAATRLAKDVIFRPLIPDDRKFFAAGWLRSFNRRGTAVKAVHSKTYFHFQQKVIQRLIRRGRVIMAADPRNPRKELFGFACWEQLHTTCVLHYVYVRGSDRGRGIGTALVNESLGACEPAASALVWTHRTGGFDVWIQQFADREAPGLPLLYNPFLIDQENH